MQKNTTKSTPSGWETAKAAQGPRPEPTPEERRFEAERRLEALLNSPEGVAVEAERSAEIAETVRLQDREEAAAHGAKRGKRNARKAFQDRCESAAAQIESLRRLLSDAE